MPSFSKYVGVTAQFAKINLSMEDLNDSSTGRPYPPLDAACYVGRGRIPSVYTFFMLIRYDQSVNIN